MAILKGVKKELFPLVESAYRALETLDDISHAKPLRNVLEVAAKEERRHRAGSLYASNFSASHPNCATVSTCAKMFVVKWIASELLKIAKGNPSHARIVIETREDNYRCAGIAQYYTAHITKAWDTFDIEYLSNLNYSDFVGSVIQ